jgi:ankyrin repeat protein
MTRLIKSFSQHPEASKIAGAGLMIVAAIGLSIRLSPRKPARPAPILSLVSANNVQKVRQSVSNDPAQLREIDFDGNTPLHIAALLGSTEMVSALLEAGADLNLKNQDGETALDAAQRAHRTAVARLLEACQSRLLAGKSHF